MSAGTALALEKAPRRSFPRHPLRAPIDVIILRSGVPQSLPGRCSDLSEGGVGAMVAGSLSPGQQVALELRLPSVGLPVRAKALVRYQGAIRCGFQFVGLPPEQREMIRYWAFRAASESASSKKIRTEPGSKPKIPPAVERTRSKLGIRQLGFKSLAIVIVVAVVLAGAAWCLWQRSWKELERESLERTTPVRVAPEEMAARVVSKVDPVYPEEARRTGTQGMAVLDALIAADGTVKRLQPVSGDELLVKSAADAVRQWKFEPYRPSNAAIEVETTIAVEFRLN